MKDRHLNELTAVNITLVSRRTYALIEASVTRKRSSTKKLPSSDTSNKGVTLCKLSYLTRSGLNLSIQFTLEGYPSHVLGLQQRA